MNRSGTSKSSMPKSRSPGPRAPVRGSQTSRPSGPRASGTRSSQVYRPKISLQPIAAKLVKDVNFDYPDMNKIFRAGIVPYCTISGTRYYCFGLEDGVGALADFGGQVDPVDRNLLDTAVREFTEETLGVFGEINKDKLQESMCLISNLTLDIVYEVEPTMSLYNELFDGRLKVKSTEVVSLVWLSKSQMDNYIKLSQGNTDKDNIYHMYDKISALLTVYSDYI